MNKIHLYGHAMTAVDYRFILVTGGGKEPPDGTNAANNSDKFSKTTMLYDNEYAVWKDLGPL